MSVKPNLSDVSIVDLTDNKLLSIAEIILSQFYKISVILKCAFAELWRRIVNKYECACLVIESIQLVIK